MCGIAGVLGERSVVQPQALRAMSDALEHRGPDDEGVEVIRVPAGGERCLGLVHRRLSIIDLSPGGHQPMYDEETGNWVVYNGELYNFSEIKDELSSAGHTFTTSSDTEVILKAYAAWGCECLQRFRGMYAIALWDNRQEQLFLAIDQAGIKPLYYSQSGDGEIIFSSEIRALLKSGLIEKKLDAAAIDSYFAFGSIQAPLTIIKGVSALLPGHYAVYDARSRTVHMQQYWRQRGVSAIERRSSLNDMLEESVRLHMRSDVPVGLFLSGGVDSSALAIHAHRVSKGPSLKSFSIVFPEEEFSERTYSRMIADRFCNEHEEIELAESDLYGSLQRALGAIDQPSIDGINTYIISRQVRERGIKTVLSGQGGDEVFGGYSSFKRFRFIKRLFNVSSRRMRRVAGSLLRGVGGNGIFNSKAAQILHSDGSPLSIYAILRQLYAPAVRRSIMSSDVEVGRSSGVPEVTSSWLASEVAGEGLFNTISALEMRLYLSNTLLRDGDVMSMAHGLEVRVPYLDRELLQYVYAMPSRLKYSSVPKSLLIETVQHELPREIYERKKMGFTFPWEIWLKNKMKAQVEAMIDSFSTDGELGLDIRECKRLWNAFLDGRPEVTWSRVWAIYVLMSWYRKNMSS